MATNKRDVELNIATNVEGTGDVKTLASTVRDLAKAGGDAAPRFEELANSMDAAAAASVLASEDAKKAAVAERDAAKAKQASADAVRLLNIETSKAAKSTEEYEAKLRGVRLQEFEASKAHRAATEARKAATAEVKRAATAERELAAEARAAVKSTTEVGDSVKRMGRESGEAADLLRRLGPMIATAFSAQQFVQTIAGQESLNRGFEQIFGSAGQAAAEMEFVRATSNRLGLETQNLARGYQSLSASTKGTVLEGQATRAIFEAVSRAMSTLGKSSAETDRALTAVSQIASKGTASMEELRGQLGEALPGAMKAAADGAGITVEQLIEMVSQGQVLASDILPALTKGLNDLYGKAAPPDNIVSNWARLKNVFTDTAVALGEGGASKAITKTLSAVAIGVQGVSYAADVAGVAIGEFAGGLATGNFQLGTAAALNAEYDAKLRKVAEAAGLVEKAQTALTDATKGGAQATQAQVRTVDQAIAAQKVAVESMLAIKARYVEALVQQGKYVDQLQREIVARQAETAAMVQLVSVYGSEIEKRQAAALAAETQAAAARNLARAREVEAVIAQSLSIKLQEEAAARKDNTEATRKEIERAQQAADAKRAEADQSRAVATSKGIEVEATKASAAAYADNAARVYELRGAAGAAALEVERLTAAQRAGKATDEQVATARAKAAAATLLYRDALDDATEAAQRKVAAESRTSRLAQEAVSVERERAAALLAVAEASGDSAAAAQAHETATRAETQAALAAADGASREAAALRAAADAQERQLKAIGALTPAKQDEIQATRDAAAAKELEAERAGILADKITALAAVERKRAQQKREELTADGLRKNADGSAAGTFNNLTPLDRAVEVQRTRGAGMSVEELRAAKKQADDGKAWLDGMVKSGGGGSIGGEAWSSIAALQRATASALERAERREVAQAEAPAEARASSSSHTVDFKFPDGSKEQFGMASEEDAARFTKTLTNLAKRTKR